MSGVSEKTRESVFTLPSVDLAGHRVARLILGSNPISGASHYSLERSREMERFFTMEKAKALLRRCEAQGINTFQGRVDRWMLRVIREHWDEGGNLKFICQTASEMKNVRSNIRMGAEAGAIAVYHHGTETDNYWAEDRIDELREIMKTARDCGVAVGIGSHKPEVIEYIEEKNWDVDFYMTCFYNVYKNSTGRRESYIVTGVFGGNHFDDGDRDRMVETIRKVSRPCLAFKILADSRKSTTPEGTEEAFRFAFGNIKKTDAVVVGMYPRDRDQVEENVALVKKYGTLQ